MNISFSTQQFFKTFDKGSKKIGDVKDDGQISRSELKEWKKSGTAEQRKMADELLKGKFEQYAGEDGKLSLEEANKYISDYNKRQVTYRPNHGPV